MTAGAAVEAVRSEGWVRLPGLFDPDTVVAALTRVRELHEVAGAATHARVPRLNRDHDLVYNLQAKDPLFCDLLFARPVLGTVLRELLNDPWYRAIPPEEPNYILRSLLARSSRGALPLHVDSFVPLRGPHPLVVQWALALQPSTATTGATVVVTGSHDSGEWADPAAHGRAEVVELDPGDVLVWDGRLWHGTTENASDADRWLVVATFCRWWMKQAWDIPGTLPTETYERLTPSQRAVMGFCSVPFPDETAGIDFRRGHDAVGGQGASA